MDKTKARELLEIYLIDQVVYPWSEIKLPLYDAVVHFEIIENEHRTYKFRYLMCLAYDLQEKKTERL